MIAPILRRLRSNETGAALVEFAIVTPVFLLLIFGTMEVGYAIYVDAALSGAVQSAGRSSGLESGQSDQAAVDDMVEERVRAITPTAQFTFTRANYENFEDIGRPEDFDDVNLNGEYDDNECFDDENDNETWDSDVGEDGQGGANDVVLYTASVEYPSLLPIAGAFGLDTERTISASTTLRNQPFATQATRLVVQVCP